MEESSEIWIMTSLSIVAALLVGLVARRLFTYVLQRVTFSENHRQMIIYTSDLFQAFISTFMLVVPTYEKCLLVGANLQLQYYLSTFILTIVYRYTLTVVSPNPLSIFAEQWKEVSTEMTHVGNGDIEAEPTPQPSTNGGVRRRGGEPVQNGSARIAEPRRNFEQPRNKVVMSIKKSAPSFIGLTRNDVISMHYLCICIPDKRLKEFSLPEPIVSGYLGLHAAIKWLHFAWDGHLTTHHTAKTGILKDCIRCLQTGPAQGFIVEAFVTFFFHAIGRKLSQQRFGNFAQSYLVTGILFSLVSTTTLYMFINITGSFANPLLAYALERECLYDMTSIINHVVVYWFGAFAGILAFYAISESKHFPIIYATSSMFMAVYFFLPNAIVLPFVIF